MCTHEKKFDNIIDAWLCALGDYFYFGRFASDATSLSDGIQDMYRELVSRAGINARSKVLAVGWGIGELEFSIHEMTGCDVRRVYHDEARIEIARERCKEKGYDRRVRFETATSIIGHFPDNHFDVVLAFESSVFFSDKAEFIADIWRILRKGGRLVFADTMLQRALTLADVFYDFREEMLALERTWGKMKMEPFDNYRKNMERSRFCNIVADNVSDQVFPTLAKWKQTAISNRNKLEEVLSNEKIDAFLRTCDIMQKFFKDDFYCYGILTGDKSSESLASES